MLQSVKIANFQAHKDSELIFAPGVNVIIGQSDSGKSSIFRAINWVASNRPLGDSFCSVWGGETSVVVDTVEGVRIERIRSSDQNAYVLNGDVLTGFGTEVPAEIITALQLDENNIQSQMDLPFLLSMTPGEAAKLLNKAASIDDIDLSISVIKRDLDKLRAKVRMRTETLAQQEQDLEKYDYLDDLELVMEEVEGLEDAVSDLKHHNKRLSELLTSMTQIQKALADIGDVETCTALLREVESAIDRLFTHHNKQGILCNRINVIGSFTEQLDDIKAKGFAEPLLMRAEDILAELNPISKTTKALEVSIYHIKQALKQTKVFNQTLKQMERDYKAIAPDECPLCGGVFPK